MSRKVIEIVQVLVDRIYDCGYQQRCREDDIADVYKRLTDAEGQAKHWRQARQEAHEAGELMKAEIETLRKELDAARAETVETRKRLNDETDRHRATHAEKIELFEQKWANQHNAELRGKLNAAQAAVTLQRAGIERLQAFVSEVRAARDEHNGLARDAIVEAALAELDASTPVAERCPECDGSGMVDSGGFGPDGKGINVPCGGDCRGNPCPSQPTPVAEPARCPECERLLRFVGGVEGALGAYQSISPDTCCDQIARCLAELEDSPTPVAEPADAEGGA